MNFKADYKHGGSCSFYNTGTGEYGVMCSDDQHSELEPLLNEHLSDCKIKKIPTGFCILGRITPAQFELLKNDMEKGNFTICREGVSKRLGALLRE